MRHRDGAALDAAMGLVDVGDAFEARGVGFREQGFDVAPRGRLVVLDGQKVVGPRVPDGLGDGGVAGDGIDRHDGALQAYLCRKPLQQHRDGRDLVRLVRNGFLPSTRRLIVAKAETRWSGAWPNALSWLPR